MRSAADGPAVPQGTTGRAARGARKPGPPRTARWAGVVVLAVACLTSMTRAQAPEVPSGPTAAGRATGRDTVPRHAFHSRADSVAWAHARAQADAATGLHVVVSLGERHLWVLYDDDTLRSAPAAVASGLTIDYEGRRWTFRTPRGRHTVLRKERDPVWRPPDWLYAETALDHGLELERLRPDEPVRLQNGSLLEVRDGLVGLEDPGGRFAALPVDEHIVFGDTLYIPPLATRNRQVAGELGRYALDLGDGYLIHGTPDHDSIGRAVTHGCIRLGDDDIKWLYTFVPVGTPVYIY